jgi:hypothetical protein
MQLTPNILAVSHLIGARRHLGYVDSGSSVISDAIVKVIWDSSGAEIPYINMLLSIEVENVAAKF